MRKLMLISMALLKYFQLKSTRKQPLPDPNGELSPSTGIFVVVLLNSY